MATAKSRSIMGKDQLEKYFHEQLKSHELQLDTQEIWDHVEGALPPRSSHLRYWLFGALFLVVAGVSWALLTNPTASDIQAENTVLSNENDSRQKQSSATYLDSEEQNVKDDQDDQTLNKSEEKGLVAMSASDIYKSSSELKRKELKSSTSTLLGAQGESRISNNKLATNDSGSDLTGGTNHKGKTTTFSSSTSTLQSEASLSQKIVNNILDAKELKETAISASFSISTSKDHNALVAENNEGINKVSQIVVSQPQIAKSDQGMGMTGEKMDHWLSLSAKERANFQVLDKTPLLDVAQLDATRSLEGETSYIGRLSRKSLSDCYDFSGRSWAWSFDLYTGLNYAAKQLKEKDQNIEMKDYVSARKNSESFLEAFEAGIAVNLMHRNGYLISAGLNYGQINEKFNFFSVKTSTMFDSVVVRINIDSTGMADTTKEWRPVTVQRTKEVLTYNSYRTIDIPISLGYQFYKGKWLYEFQGGVMFNLAFKQKGEILDEKLNVNEIGDGETFKNGLGISVFGSFKAIYPVNDHLGLFVEPVVRFNVKPITVGGYALDQRYNQFGLRLGARLTF